MLTPSTDSVSLAGAEVQPREARYPAMPCAIGPYVPHDAGMCLLDSVLRCDEHSLSADITPTPDNLFAEPDADGRYDVTHSSAVFAFRTSSRLARIRPSQRGSTASATPSSSAS